MDSFQRIHSFLKVVRRRLRGRAAARALLTALAALTIVLLAVPLAAAWLKPDHAPALRALAMATGSALLVGLALFGVVVPRRKFRADGDVARWVGGAAPQVASDLLSTVELQTALHTGGGDPRFSRELAVALAESTAARVAQLRPAALVPARPVKQAGAAFLGAALLYVAFLGLAPKTVKTGWRRLLAPPDPVPTALDAVAVPEPLVGDINLTLTYPKYMGRPPLVVPASSGDVTAPRGTEIAIETRALVPAVAARIIFDGAPEADALHMAVAGDVLRAKFIADKPGSYRFLLEPPGKRPLVEADPHRLDIEADRAPRVELYAPADELEVSARKRIELAYTTDDDYGLGEIALVWRSPGGHDERKVIPAAGAKNGRTGRSDQGKFLWDLADVQLTPGARVAYHLEVKDNDDVGGPNIGASRTFYLKVYSPRERHEEILGRLDAVLEMALALLGDRLELDATDVASHRKVHQSAQQLVVELGQLAALVGQDPLATKGLKEDLEAMRGRLDKAAHEEQTTLETLEARVAKAPPGATAGGVTKTMLAPLLEQDKKQVVELERDVLLLDDWLERARLEELLAIADEIKQHKDRLKELLAEYKRTGSDKVRAEIDRELKALEQLQAELARKQAQLGGEAADRFLNAEALASEDAQDCLQQARALLEKGDVTAAQLQLEKCGARLDAAAKALEQGLRGLRGEKFSEEEKAYSELLDEIADLEAAQRDVAREADALMDSYKQRAAEVARDQANPQKEKAKKTLEKLKKELEAVPKDGLTPFAQEELDALHRRVDDVEKMLEEGDVAEALAMARQAREGIQTIQAELDDDMADGQPTSDETDEAMEQLQGAEPLAEKLVEELEKATPSPEEIMSPQDRRKMAELERRQQALEERARKLGQKAEKKGPQLPGRAGETAKQGLDEAGEQMERGAERMQGFDPGGAREEAHGAADKLANLRKQLGNSSRPTSINGNGRDNDDDEVRIPGAEDYKPPEEFREDILEAKRKEKAPEAFRDQVERYYQELVK